MIAGHLRSLCAPSDAVARSLAEALAGCNSEFSLGCDVFLSTWARTEIPVLSYR